jgi:hypothetical protein
VNTYATTETPAQARSRKHGGTLTQTGLGTRIGSFSGAPVTRVGSYSGATDAR